MGCKKTVAWAPCLLLIVLSGCARHQDSASLDVNGGVSGDLATNQSVEFYRANTPYSGPPPHEPMESTQPCALANVGEDGFFYFHNLTTGYYYMVLPHNRFGLEDGVPFMKEVNASGQHIHIAFVRSGPNGTVALVIFER